MFDDRQPFDTMRLQAFGDIGDFAVRPRDDQARRPKNGLQTGAFFPVRTAVVPCPR